MKTNHPFTGVFTVLSCLLSGAGLVICLSGCVVPMPHIDSGFTRTNVNEQVVGQFAPGQTTREDVILTLGEPDVVSAGERELAYRSEKLSAIWFVPVMGAPAPAGPIYDHRYFIFTFNAPGQFQSVWQTNEQPSIVWWQEAAVQPQAAPDNSNGVHVVVSGYSYWQPKVDGFQGGVAQTTGGTLGYLLLTESNLVFVSESDFACPRPVLDLPLTAISRVHVDSYFFTRRLLVIHTDAGAVHSFRIYGTVGGGNNPAMKTACSFIQSKIQSTQLAK